MLPGPASDSGGLVFSSKEARRPSLVLLAALAAGLIAAGCGGADEEEYREGYREAAEKFETGSEAGGAKMRAAGQSKDKAQYSEGAREFQRAIDDFNGELEDLEEPDSAKEEEEAVREALTRLSEAVGRVNAAVQSDSERQVRAEVAALDPLVQQVRSAEEALDEAL
jgi:hypothetical protein